MFPNKKHNYYAGDDVTFRGSFRIDNVAQTPDADTCTVTIKKTVDEDTDTTIVTDATGIIAGTQLQYKYSDIPIGQYAIFLTAKYNSGADQRTGVIEFVVKNKEAD